MVILLLVMRIETLASQMLGLAIFVNYDRLLANTDYVPVVTSLPIERAVHIFYGQVGSVRIFSIENITHYYIIMIYKLIHITTISYAVQKFLDGGRELGRDRE